MQKQRKREGGIFVSKFVPLPAAAVNALPHFRNLLSPLPPFSATCMRSLWICFDQEAMAKSPPNHACLQLQAVMSISTGQVRPVQPPSSTWAAQQRSQVFSFTSNPCPRLPCKPSKIMVALVEETTAVSPKSSTAAEHLAYELVQGALVSLLLAATLAGGAGLRVVADFCGSPAKAASFARRLAQEFPTWQFLLADLRCHGGSSDLEMRGPHTVSSAARDVLQLVARLKLTPRILVGHSFGGKVALSMVDQAAKPLPRPVKVWVLDATPGRVRAGGDGEDHPEDLIAALREMPPVVTSRRWVIEKLCGRGFSSAVSQWMTTNLKPVESGGNPGFGWVFDLDGIASMYQSYEDTNLWPLVEDVPEGVHINFLRAERSLHRWAREDVQRIHAAEMIASTEGAGVEMHVLEDAGHWVHADNPDGLFRMLAPSFGGKEPIHM